MNPSKVEFLRTISKFRKREEILPSLVYKEMYKKARCMCKIVVLVIKPIAFLKFSLLSLSLDLKVPTDTLRGIK